MTGPWAQRRWFAEAREFDAVPWPTKNYKNHWVITHPAGEAGFTPANPAKLSSMFINVPTPW